MQAIRFDFAEGINNRTTEVIVAAAPNLTSDTVVSNAIKFRSEDIQPEHDFLKLTGLFL